jgi:hypothetical protein
MANTRSNTLVLAGTGKTGSRVAAKLTRFGLSVRRAARNDADVRFDWDDPATHSPALDGVDWAEDIAAVADEYSEMLRMLTETVAPGHGSRPNSDVLRVTGVPPISFADFARRTAQAWA